MAYRGGHAAHCTAEMAAFLVASDFGPVAPMAAFMGAAGLYATGLPETVRLTTIDRDRADFATQAEAQAFFELGPG
jgi:hypothetical protein